MLEKLLTYKKQKHHKKGFTLVELIVVLVILAILMAILIPSMVGWIDKAKEKQILVNARVMYLAVQTLASEQYARDTSTSTITPESAEKLAQVPGTVTDTIRIKNGSVTYMQYTENSKVVVFEDNGWYMNNELIAGESKAEVSGG